MKTAEEIKKSLVKTLTEITIEAAECDSIYDFSIISGRLKGLADAINYEVVKNLRDNKE